MSQSKSPLSKKEIHPLFHGPFSSCTYTSYRHIYILHHITKGYITFTILTFATTTQTTSNIPQNLQVLHHAFPWPATKQKRKQRQSPECATWLGRSGWLIYPTCDTCVMALMFGGSSSINMYHGIDFQGNPQTKSKSRP